MAEKKQKTGFEELYEINVNEKTEDKNGLTYLSWAWAWAEFKKRHPEATYEIKKFEGGIPYAYDENTGYMVYTSVTVDGLTHEMWLPVMDSNNKAMKNKPYEVKTKYKTLIVNAATMFDINKTIMRCLTKNLAMFGLGLYIYAGEDLPETDEASVDMPKEDKTSKNKDKDIAELKALLEETNSDVAKFLEWCSTEFKRSIPSVDDMNSDELKAAIKIVSVKKGA